MFITFEGIEGSGKTTQIKRLAKALKERGIPCLVTREPGATKIGLQIRAILLDRKNNKMDPLAELFLYLADRCQHMREKISPALAQGRWVISDRFWDATVVYQGLTRGLNLKFLNQLRPKILGSVWPDKTFLLDLPVSIGLGRAWERINNSEASRKESRFEKEAEAFHQKIRLGYLNLSLKEPNRIVVIDATHSPDQIHKKILKNLFD
ncbi:MAG: dTMP kinase [Deltaproteobacteria bacterium]|nr:dTMP kinase [Deltaproteobacteria bacterium]